MAVLDLIVRLLIIVGLVVGALSVYNEIEKGDK